MASISLHNIIKKYNNNIVISNFSLDVQDKEFLVLLGPSGCGKSTLLRMIAGLEDVSSGDIMLDGKIINNLQPNLRDIAMVFQDYALYPHLSIKENLSLPLKLRHVDKSMILQKINETAEILGIHHLIDRYPIELSGGEKQRVALGRAIIRNPRVFLFDEPLSNLDVSMRSQMRELIIKLHNKLKTTMIYVTHDQLEAMTMGDRICVIKNGSIQQLSSPLDVYLKPINTFVAQFIGSPSMNLIPGTLQVKNSNIFFTTADNQTLILSPNWMQEIKMNLNKQVYLGIRAEDIALEENNNLPLGTYLNVNIERRELVGADFLLYFTLRGNNITYISRVPNDSIFGNNNSTLKIRIDKAHIYDIENGEIII